MRSTSEAAVSSVLPDVRAVPLAKMPSLGTVTLNQALARALPDSSACPVPVAAFNSAI
jgi:FXSXX-COOH protein